jgi:hypothetical protein
MCHAKDVANARSNADKLRHADGIGKTKRGLLLAAGLGSWGAGGTASFLSDNGAGAAALVAVGAVCGGLALIGRWPSRISMSGNELAWEDVKETVDSQIEVAETSGEDASVLNELRYLRERLDFLQRTGSVSKHPAQVYDEAVQAAVRRLLPQAELTRQQIRSRSIADFVLRYQGRQLLLETKWRADPEQPYRGRTLPNLLERLAQDATLLVVVNAHPSAVAAAQSLVNDSIGARGRVAGWLDVRDDGELARALTSLLGSANASS